MSKDNWEKCPRCESNRVKKRGFLFTFLVGFCTTGISMWLLIIPPIGILGILIGLLITLSSFGAKGQLYCEDCNNTWKPDAD